MIENLILKKNLKIDHQTFITKYLYLTICVYYSKSCMDYKFMWEIWLYAENI
jgi:hypothetical protein